MNIAYKEYHSYDGIVGTRAHWVAARMRRNGMRHGRYQLHHRRLPLAALPLWSRRWRWGRTMAVYRREAAGYWSGGCNNQPLPPPIRNAMAHSTLFRHTFRRCVFCSLLPFCSSNWKVPLFNYTETKIPLFELTGCFIVCWKRTGKRQENY